jgi:hypothetical protein
VGNGGESVNLLGKPQEKTLPDSGDLFDANRSASKQQTFRE